MTVVEVWGGRERDRESRKNGWRGDRRARGSQGGRGEGDSCLSVCLLVCMCNVENTVMSGLI